MCDKYKVSDNRIKVIHKKNAGAGLARNSGIDIATSEYVSFIDADDYISLDMYEKVYNSIKRENADTCIYGYNRIIDGNLKYTRTISLKGTFSDQEHFKNIFLNSLGSEPKCKDDYLILWQSPCLSLYKLEIIRDNNILFPSEREFIAEDYLFITEYFFYSKKVTIVNEALYYYSMNQSSLTTVYRQDNFHKFVIVFLEQLRRLKKYLPDDDAYYAAEQRIQRNLLTEARNCILEISRTFPYNKNSSRLIQDICNNMQLQRVLNVYPWNKNPIKFRVFNYILKKRSSCLLYIMASLNKYII